MTEPRQLLLPLEKESEKEWFRFVRRMVEEYRSGVNRFDRCGEAFFVAKLSEQIIGFCGLNQDPYTHDPMVGRVQVAHFARHRRGKAVLRDTHPFHGQPRIGCILSDKRICAESPL